MAKDIFSRNVAYGGSFSADGARVTFDWDTGSIQAGMLVQRIAWQYAQTISRVYDVAGPEVYLVAGRTQGQVSLDTILGPKRLLTSFYRKFGDVCQAKTNHIKFSARTGCGDGSGSGSIGGQLQEIQLKHCVIDRLGGSVAAENMLIQSQISMMFLLMKMTGGSGSPSDGMDAGEMTALGPPVGLG